MHLHFLFINQEGSHNFEEVFWGIKKNKKIKTSKREKTLPLRSYAVGRRTERTCREVSAHCSQIQEWVERV